MAELQPNSPGSVSREIEGVKQKDPQAVQDLWERCFRQLRRMARRKLGNLPGAVADSEDVASEVFACLCRGIAADRWPQLDNREDLWRILFTLTRHKAIDLIRRETAPKHGGGAFQYWSGDVAAEGLGPEDIVILDDQLSHLLGKLPDESFRKIARLKLKLHTVPEMAEILGYAPRTIERKLSLIRKIWGTAFEENEP